MKGPTQTLTTRAESVKAEVRGAIKSYQEGIAAHADATTKAVILLRADLSKARKRLGKVKDEPLQAEVESILQALDTITDSATKFETTTTGTREKVTKQFDRCTADLDASVQQAQNDMQGVIEQTTKALQKTQKKVGDAASARLDDIFARADLDPVLAGQREDFQAFMDRVTSLLAEVRTALEKYHAGALEDVTRRNHESFSAIQTEGKAELERLDQVLGTHAQAVLERTRDMALRVTLDEGGLPASKQPIPADTPALDETLAGELGQRVVEAFQAATETLQAQYRATFEAPLGPLFTSTEAIASELDELLGTYASDQVHAFEENRAAREAATSRLGTALDAQLQEFRDIIDLDLAALLRASQEIIGRIMVKSAETSSTFGEVADESLAQGRAVVEEFIGSLQTTLGDFTKTLAAKQGEIEALRPD